MKYHENQSYGSEPQHKYDLAEVRSDTLLVLVHGGGWIGGDKRDPNWDYGECVKYVAERYGMSVASVNYTLATEDTPTAPLNKDGPKPRPTHNVMTAARITADRVGAKRITLLGTSAGANIAALTFRYYPDLIHGFIGFYGAYNLARTSDFPTNVQGMIETYTGSSFPKKLEASPQLTDFPKRKYLLYHGNSDNTVPPIQSALMQMRHPSGEFHTIAGAGHAIKPFGEKDSPSPWVERLVRYIHTGD
jgi:acetyl esterase/lipase